MPRKVREIRKENKMNTMTDKARELEKIMRENARGNICRLGGLGIDEKNGNLTIVPRGGNDGMQHAIVHDPDVGGRFGCGVSVAVILKDDLKRMSKATTSMDGWEYTIDAEGVTHLSLSPDPTAKGTVSAAMFCLGGDLATHQGIDMNQVRFVVERDVRNGDVSVCEVCSNGERRPIQNVMLIPAREERFALGTGLLESPILECKRVLFLGCGSMGADLVMHLVQAGIGHAVLCDMDRVEASNLNRLRDASLADCGRLKVDVLEERIRGKNPYCDVVKVSSDITQDESMMEELLHEVDLVIVSTDNHASRTLIAKELERIKLPCVFARCTTRAESGDVLITRPGECCYNCLFSQGADDAVDDWASAKKAGRLAAYARPEDMQHYKVLPGISTDITAITSFAARMAIWELLRNEKDNPFGELNKEFMSFNYFLYVNRREYAFKNGAWAPFDDSGQGKVCAQRWYGAKIPRLPSCMTCGTGKGMLDNGEGEDGLLEGMCKRGFSTISDKK